VEYLVQVAVVVPVLVWVVQAGDVCDVKENVLKGLHGNVPLLDFLLQQTLR